MSTEHTLKLSSVLDMLFHTCTTAKIMKHQTQRGETLKNGCVSHLKTFSPEILWVNTVKAGQAVSNTNSKI